MSSHLKLPIIQKLFKLIGFEKGSTRKVFLLPHDKPLTLVFLALESLTAKVA